MCILLRYRIIEDEYLDRLTKLHNIVSECDSSCISIVGDFNATVKTNAKFAVLMKEFCEQFNYVWTSLKCCLMTRTLM